MNAEKFLLLHDEDNVLVCCRGVQAGERVMIDGHACTIHHAVALGHKVARHHISAGAGIIKYGVSVGSATQAITTGEHVHLHNMRSDYIAAHSRKQLKDLSQHK